MLVELVALLTKDENRTKISRTKPHHFLYLTRSNSYFQTKYEILNLKSKYEIVNSKSERIRFRVFLTDFYFSILYSEYTIL